MGPGTLLVEEIDWLMFINNQIESRKTSTRQRLVSLTEVARRPA